MYDGASKLQVVADDGLLILRGEFDAADRQDLTDHIKDPVVRIVDLSGVTFMDSTALSVLAFADQLRPGELRLRRPTEPPRRLLRLSGLDQVMPIDDC